MMAMLRMGCDAVLTGNPVVRSIEWQSVQGCQGLMYGSARKERNLSSLPQMEPYTDLPRTG
jgi:hypothetical protein